MSLKLPSIFQDHMMLQRDKALHMWGEAEGMETVLISLGEESISVPVTEGKFSCLFPAQSAGREQTLRFAALKNGAETEVLTLQHISIGDIYLASGQSNMEFFLRYDANWQDTLREKRTPDIHMYNCPQIAFAGQEKDTHLSGYWFGEGDPAWPVFSAPGYSFAKQLQEDLQIPIGIIGCNWGGTPACAWMDEEHLKDPVLSVFTKEYEKEIAGWEPEELKKVSMEALAFENSYKREIEWRAMMYGLTWEEQLQWMKEHTGDPVLPMGPYHHYRPGGLYHTMIEPIAPFSIKGILWYQGESDSGHADIYDRTMTALIDCFRKTWQDESLPFLFVQLAPFARWLECTGDNYTMVRDRQEKVSKTVPGAYMASIMDLGMHDDIHPKHKMEVGRRLALLARGHVYGEDILCDAPEIRDMERTDDTVILTFRHAGEGLKADEQGDSAFVCTQGDRTLRIRSCSIEKDKVILQPEEVDPAASLQVDFAQSDWCEVHILNSAGLAVKPFTIVG